MINKHLQELDNFTPDKPIKGFGTPLLSSKTSPQLLKENLTPEAFNELAYRAADFLSAKAEPHTLRVVEEFPRFDQDIISQLAQMRTGR